MNWFERIERLQRKSRRQVIKRNVRAYRKRQQLSGIRRIDVALTREQFAALWAFSQSGETFSASVGRMIEAISGNTNLA